MKKIDIKKSFKTKRFKYGGFSTLAIIVLVLVLLVVNIAVQRLNIKKDLTQGKIYSITDQSKNLLNSLKADTNIIAFFETGKEDPGIKAVLEQYKNASNKITVEYKDPAKYPTIVEKYSKGGIKPSTGSVVVESGDKFKIISADDFFNQTVDSTTGESQVSSFTAEQQITNAILYVNSNKEQVLYTLSGHEEGTLPSEVSKQLQAENYTIKDINLLQGSASLIKDSILAIVSPKKDLSKDETQKIKTFLNNGGRAAFFMDITKESLPNFQEVLSVYGVKLQNAVVVEGQAENVANTPVYLLPNMQSQDITNELKTNKLFVLMPLSQGIEELKSKKSTTTIEPLLITSSNSWGKLNLNATTFSKEKGDLQGPFNIAVAITDEDTAAAKTTKLIVVGNSYFMNSDAITATNGNNLDFAVNSLNWLQDKKDSVSIRPKDLTAPNLIMNDLQKLLLSGLVVLLIPTIIMGIGITIWLRRRHR
jgi:ABC-2 type transport system permease protein